MVFLFIDLKQNYLDMISLSERKRLMDNDNYKLYTKDVLNLIFSNQDIDQLIPYLSKDVKAMGLYTEDVLKYNDIINHIKTYKSNHFTFYIDQFTCTVIYQNNSVCITEGVFYLNMEEYQTRTKYFIQLYLKIIK